MLHNKSAIGNGLDDDVFASADASVNLPKYKMPEQEHAPRVIHRLVADELLLDGNSRQNLATFCQTWLEPEVLDLMTLTVDKNLVDKDEYPQTAEIENRCVHILADLWNTPESANAIGTSTTGSSEAAMLGGMALLGTGARAVKRGESLLEPPIWSLDRCRCVGINSAVIGEWNCAKFRWRATALL